MCRPAARVDGTEPLWPSPRASFVLTACSFLPGGPRPGSEHMWQGQRPLQGSFSSPSALRADPQSRRHCVGDGREGCAGSRPGTGEWGYAGWQAGWGLSPKSAPAFAPEPGPPQQLLGRAEEQASCSGRTALPPDQSSWSPGGAEGQRGCGAQLTQPARVGAQAALQP